MTMQMVMMMQQTNIERAIEDADDDKATIKLRELIIPMTYYNSGNANSTIIKPR